MKDHGMKNDRTLEQINAEKDRLFDQARELTARTCKIYERGLCTLPELSKMIEKLAKEFSQENARLNHEIDLLP